MTDHKKLAEDIGNVFSNIAKRQNIYDWLSQQPLSHDWKKEDIQNCKPEYVAVLTKEEREFLLKDCEDSLRYKYKNDETEKKNRKSFKRCGCIFAVLMLFIDIVFFKWFFGIISFVCFVLGLDKSGTAYVEQHSPRKKIDEYLASHPNAREEFLAANKKILDAEAERRDTEKRALARITEDFYKETQKVTRAFSKFIKKSARQHCVDYFIDNSVEYGSGLKMPTRRIFQLFVGLDLLKVCERLGYPYDIFNLSFFPFVSLSISYPDVDTEWDYEDLSWRSPYSKAEEYYEDIQHCVGENANAGVEYFGIYILQKSGYGHEDEYLRLIYRFASLVAKADGNISTEEADQLKAIQRQVNEFCSQKNENDLPLPPELPAPKPKKPEQPADNAHAEEKPVQQNEAQPDTKQDEAEKPKPAKPALEQLDELIGLEGVKAEIHKLHNYVKIQRKREACGMQSVPLAVHCVFTGNPGTGKTTVARILAEIFKDLGLLKKGHLVETDRSGLVAEYVGQTAVKTNKIIDSTLDGVLFIDEAYTLASGGSNDYGHEAVATLLKRMEDNRDRLIVIIAGYKDEMQKFIDMNPGLQSRFTRYINFEDYNALALARIFHLNAKRYGYTLSPDAERRLNTVLTDMVLHKDEHFGNAREVRNLFEQTLQHQADRLIGIENVSDHDLATIEAEDIIG